MSEAFDSIMRGLSDVKAHRKGDLELKIHTISVAPVPRYTSRNVKAIRNRLHLTQSTFASVFGVSKKTVEAWESGYNSPNGTAQRLLSFLDNDKDLLQREKVILEG